MERKACLFHAAEGGKPPVGLFKDDGGVGWEGQVICQMNTQILDVLDFLHDSTPDGQRRVLSSWNLSPSPGFYWHSGADYVSCTMILLPPPPSCMQTHHGLWSGLPQACHQQTWWCGWCWNSVLCCVTAFGKTAACGAVLKSLFCFFLVKCSPTVFVSHNINCLQLTLMPEEFWQINVMHHVLQGIIK